MISCILRICSFGHFSAFIFLILASIYTQLYTVICSFDVISIQGKNKVILSQTIDKETDRSEFETRELKDVNATKDVENRFQNCPRLQPPPAPPPRTIQKSNLNFFWDIERFSKDTWVSSYGHRTNKLARFQGT